MTSGDNATPQTGQVLASSISSFVLISLLYVVMEIVSFIVGTSDFYLNYNMIARIKEECVEEFAEILKNVKDTGREYKNFVAGTIAVCAWLIAWKRKRDEGMDTEESLDVKK